MTTSEQWLRRQQMVKQFETSSGSGIVLYTVGPELSGFVVRSSFAPSGDFSRGEYGWEPSKSFTTEEEATVYCLSCIGEIDKIEGAKNEKN